MIVEANIKNVVNKNKMQIRQKEDWGYWCVNENNDHKQENTLKAQKYIRQNKYIFKLQIKIYLLY